MVLLLVAALAASVATVSPSAGGRHDRFAVAITSRHATGVSGQTRRSYVAEAHAAHPASGCVNNRDRVFGERRAGARTGQVARRMGVASSHDTDRPSRLLAHGAPRRPAVR